MLTHSSARAFPDQVNDAHGGQVVQFPTRLSKTERIIQVLQVHEEALVQQPNLIDSFTAEHETRPGKDVNFQWRLIGRVRFEAGAQGTAEDTPKIATQE